MAWRLAGPAARGGERGRQQAFGGGLGRPGGVDAALQRGLVEEQELCRQGRGIGGLGDETDERSEEPLRMLARDGRRGVLRPELNPGVREGVSAVPGRADLDGEQVVQVQDALDR